MEQLIIGVLALAAIIMLGSRVVRR